MMLEADVSLLGHMTPVMARLTDSTSDLTFSEWLTLVKGHGKGIKLDFKTIDAVEIALQKLEKSRSELKVPVHLNAAVIDGSSLGQSQVIDADRFLNLCTSKVADSTLSLGWVIDQGAQRYNWTMVKMMYDLIERWHISQPMTFSMRASLAHQSMPQVRWLMEMVSGSTLTLVSSSNDVSVDELLYVRHHLPHHAVYYDIPQPLQEQLIAFKDDISHFPKKQLSSEESQAFVSDQWKVVRSRDGETIYLGTETVVMRTGLLVTKAEYESTRHHPVIITGRVEFFNTTFVNTDKSSRSETGNDEQGLAVFVRASQSSRADSVSGIRCFFGVGGELRLELYKVPGADGKSQNVLPGTSPCIAFRIIDRGTSGIEAYAARPKSCSSDFTINKDVDFEAKVSLSMDTVTTGGSYIAIKQSTPVGFIAVDRFSIHTQRSLKQLL